MKVKHVLLTIVSFGLLCALLLPAPMSAVAADNLAANGDLELGNTNGWEIASATIDTAVVHSGSYSLKMTSTAAYSGAAYKAVPVRKNATVTVSFYYRYESDPGSNLYHVYTYQGADAWTGTYSGADASFSKPTGCNTIATWKQVSYTFNSGNNTSIYLKFSPEGNGCNVACYIDDLVVTTEGGDETPIDPYLTSYGTKMARPINASANLLQNGGFESTASAQWNTDTFIKGGLSVVEDSTAPEGSHSLCLNYTALSVATWYYFPVTVEAYTQYTFSAWVKSPRLSNRNQATGTFGVMGSTDAFLVYEPYNGTGNGVASLSTTKKQLMATSPDDEWHLRSVTFYSGTHTTVYVGVYGTRSCLYLDDMALFRSSNGVEYISDLRTDTITASNTTGNKYCADEDSLIEGIYMTTNDARLTWSKNPAWRNGFLSFTNVSDAHGTVLKYTASDKTALAMHYIDWVDVQPNTNYTLTLDVKRLSAGGGRIALLDDDYDSPKEFYTISFSAADSDWVTYSVTFNTGAYSRIGFAIVDGGGSALIDEVRLFETAKGTATKPGEPDEPTPTLKVEGGPTSVMEMTGGEKPMVNSEFEEGTLAGWTPYQQTAISEDTAHGGYYSAHLKGDGSWGALLEQQNIPVVDGKTYTLSFWYKVNAVGSNVSLRGTSTGTQYAYAWASAGGWTHFAATFTVAGDTTLLFNACGGGTGVAEDLYLDNVRLIPADSTAKMGIAFLMEMEGYHITVNDKNEFDAPNATVIPYGDGVSYPLVRMGAVMTNQTAIGTEPEMLTLSNVNSTTVTDVPAAYLLSTSDTGCRFAVRVVNVPEEHCATEIYARPYYVFEQDGREIVVYGDIYSRSYDG